MVSTCVARTMRSRIEYDASARTNSVRVERQPRLVGVDADDRARRRRVCSSACAMRLPQNVPSPVTRIRIALSRTTRCGGCAACRRAPLDERPDLLRLFHHHAAVVALLAGLHVEVTGGSTRMRNFAGR